MSYLNGLGASSVNQGYSSTSMGVAGNPPNYSPGGNTFSPPPSNFGSCAMGVSPAGNPYQPNGGGNPYAPQSPAGNPYAPPGNSYMGGPPNNGGFNSPGYPPMQSQGSNPFMNGPAMNAYNQGPPAGNPYQPNGGGNPYAPQSPAGNPYAPQSPAGNSYMGGSPNGMPSYQQGGCGQPMNSFGGGPQPVAARSNNAHWVQGNGKRRALIFGINYLQSTKGRLNGCINDAHNMARFMSQHFGFREVRVMTDDTPVNSPNHPTKQNMIDAMHWLVAGAKPGDSFFFHYSGHGGQSEDKTHLEDDGLNETILPADWQQKGMIVDDDLHDILVRKLPEGVRFTAIFDSCHSGTALDLPYLYKVQSGQFKNAHKAKEDRFWGRHQAKLKKDKVTGIGGATKALFSHVGGEVSHQTKKKVRQTIMERRNTTKAVVIMFSGCRDDQTSADTTMANQATGAMSYAFIDTLTKHNNAISYADLLAGMRESLHNGPKQFTQFPQLSYGKPMDMGEHFTM